MASGGRHGSRPVYRGSATRWFRNTYSFISIGAIVSFQFVVIVILFQFASTTKLVFNRVLNLILLCFLIAYIVIIISMTYYKYPIRYGISKDGIHLRFLGRTETLYWEIIKSIERVKGDRFGGTVIKKSGDRKQVIGMVSSKVFDEMNRGLEKHQSQLTRHA